MSTTAAIYIAICICYLYQDIILDMSNTAAIYIAICIDYLHRNFEVLFILYIRTLFFI